MTTACRRPVNKRCDRETKSLGVGRRRWTLFGDGSVDGRRPEERDAIRSVIVPERCDNERTNGAGVNPEDGSTTYHSVRQRFPTNDTSSSSSTEPVSVYWFGNCWWIRSPSTNTIGDNPHQHHHYHHLRAHRHRHHHHTHHLHMWTSSYCWWLLVLYAAVVVVASFARAAHSAKDGKYFSP